LRLKKVKLLKFFLFWDGAGNLRQDFRRKESAFASGENGEKAFRGDGGERVGDLLII
jgi:hypothetical protein